MKHYYAPNGAGASQFYIHCNGIERPAQQINIDVLTRSLILDCVHHSPWNAYRGRTFVSYIQSLWVGVQFTFSEFPPHLDLQLPSRRTQHFSNLTYNGANLKLHGGHTLAHSSGFVVAIPFSACPMFTLCDHDKQVRIPT